MCIHIYVFVCGDPGAGITSICKPPQHECWELNLDPSEQQALSLSSPHLTFSGQESVIGRKLDKLIQAERMTQIRYQSAKYMATTSQIPTWHTFPLANLSGLQGEGTGERRLQAISHTLCLHTQNGFVPELVF